MANLVRQLVDRFGRTVKRPTAQDLRVRSVHDSVGDRAAIDRVLSDVTPQRLVSIFNDADSGYIARQVELAQTITERDAHVSSLLQTRSLAVTELDWAINAGANDDTAKEAAEACQQWWDRIDSDALFHDLLRALGEQWALVEVEWDVATYTPIGFTEIDARRLVWPQVDGDDICVAAPALSIDHSPTNTIDVRPGQFVLHSYRDRRNRPGADAPVRSIAFWWMCKRWASMDFVTLVEQFGKPWRAVKHDANATTEQIRTILTTLKQSASDMAIAIPQTAELQLIQGMSGGEPPHGALIRLANDEIAKAIIGNTTTNDAAPNNDSVSSPTHLNVVQRIRNADAKALAATINRDLIAMWCAWNYGPDVASPNLAPILSAKQDPQARSQVYLNAAQLGLRVPSAQLYEDLGIERPDDVEDVITLSSGGVNPLAQLFGQQSGGRP